MNLRPSVCLVWCVPRQAYCIDLRIRQDSFPKTSRYCKYSCLAHKCTKGTESTLRGASRMPIVKVTRISELAFCASNCNSLLFYYICLSRKGLAGDLTVLFLVSSALITSLFFFFFDGPSLAQWRGFGTLLLRNRPWTQHKRTANNLWDMSTGLHLFPTLRLIVCTLFFVMFYQCCLSIIMVEHRR